MLTVVLSGGPCGGKSTALSKIKQAVEDKLGMDVFTIPETATELISSGVTPAKMSSKAFQRAMLKKQLAKEELYKGIISTEFNRDRSVLILDRGILDQLAYINDNDFIDLLREQGLSLSDVVDRYDLIIHMVTAAEGTTFYTTENNAARKESASEARMLDFKTIKGNSCSPHVKIVDNKTGFDKKVDRAIGLVFQALKKPAPSEIERKFLIKMPNISTFIDPDMLGSAVKVEITQDYLIRHSDNVERRVRARKIPNGRGTSYYYTEKTVLSPIERIEREEIITEQQYRQLLLQKDKELMTIEKSRYSFVYDGRYFELDTYPFPPFAGKYAVLEIELETKEDDFKLPEYLEVVKEVTDDPRFKNSQLAKTVGFKLD